ncbi:multidrug resistance efflux transporter family protein [Peribacillus tepidiphilus]|uniref:DMT family transporter n=1 Tax=Peribacillus tepidiphilus TaxID=2652445 RepID=UPI001292AF76|nr:multidrug resistance efflux transporter family protein [Peribacillus tepidiphilus]
MKPIILGIFAAFFFAFTFILNHVMELSGGSWIWSASLRYFFMVPFLFLIVVMKGNFRALLKVMKEHPKTWLVWSFIGFGMFYTPLCFAAAYSPGWLIAGTWQITIISGSLLVPFFSVTIQTKEGPVKVREKIPIKGLLMSLMILLGIIFMQVEHANHLSLRELLLGVLPVIIASFAYPLGNRKMMEVCRGRLDPYQRVLGMTLASLPFWFVLSLYGLFTGDVPSGEQAFQSVLVAIFSGVIATVLFFKATEMVRGDMQKLAAVEATQSMEVLFALLGELLLLSIPIPSILSWSGMMVLIVGMILHSYVLHQKDQTHNQAASV